MDKITPSLVIVVTIIIGVILTFSFIPIRSFKPISAEDMWNIINEDQYCFIVDTRSFEEYSNSHINQSLWFNISNHGQINDNLPSDRSILIIAYCECERGGTAFIALRYFQDKKYNNLYYLEGRFSEVWIHPTINSTKSKMTAQDNMITRGFSFI